MGRIAYLSKRGRIWWFRRRHPAIIISQGQLPVFSGSYEDNRVTAQARGHLAVSLQTSSVREARLLAAKIAEHFERAWSKFETEITAMNDHPAQDLIDKMALTLTEGFRKYITHYRTMNVATLTPEVRERVFATIDAELRQSLGIAQLPYDDMFKRTTPAPIQYISIKETPPEERTPEEQEYYAWEEKTRAECLGVIENIIESENRKTAYLDVTESRLIDPDDEDGVERIEDFASGLGALLNDFITTCEKEGRNISQELPAARRIARSLYDSAKRLGLPEANTRSTKSAIQEPQYSDLAFSAFAEQYLKLRCEGYTLKKEDETPYEGVGESFKKSSLGNARASVRLFTDIVGDLPLRDINKDDILDFNALVQKLPKNHGKSANDQRTAREVVEDIDSDEVETRNEMERKLAEQGLPPAEIEDRLAAARVKRISARTVQRHQTALKAILDYALSRRLIESNPFKGRVLTEAEVNRRKRTENRVARKGWGEEIYTLLRTKVFREPLDSPDEPLFWAPLIAMFAGLRLEEILQLRIRDFGKEDGIFYVAVQNEIGSQTTKSESSIRRVPLHNALLDLGLPELVDIRRQQGMSRLFPHMTRSKSKGTFSAIMSKRFGYYRRSVGITDDFLDFHALRTEFHVRLTRAGVEDYVRKILMGHQHTEVTYTAYLRAGLTMENLKNAVDKNNINYAGVLPPFGRMMFSQTPQTLRLVSSTPPPVGDEPDKGIEKPLEK
ncbi:MAG: tyrosine-type recombinase/integrase [Rhodobacteraceae bacterium]|nr:tyrosine-type recombinase/integrase [Paracoccaceae bacterium]